jgi:glycosyltransferase involved in cell wall biosynthesis
VPWLAQQWQKLQPKRVIWRTCGQSNAELEQVMGVLRRTGLEIVRYSPKEKHLGNFAGEDAMIRFGKYPEDFPEWTGEHGQVINVTQHLYQRHPHTNWEFWEVATADLPRLPIGPGSKIIGGIGEVTTDEMYRFLSNSRAYLYTGTQPASYTLGLIEAMMTGIPVASIGPAWMALPELFEGHELTGYGFEDPTDAASVLRLWLNDEAAAQVVSAAQRDTALRTFGIEVIGPQWQAYLDG